ncbi:MAG TPA: hypothetical protein VFN21_11940 [Acidimicrobiales bacterium]|nr:hypothetical protein [Acidimicrobiales bacterium]
MSEDEQHSTPAEVAPEIADHAARESVNASSLDDLVDDLRRVAGMRSPKALRDAHLPVLATYLDVPDDPDRRLAGYRRGITGGLESIDDPQFRAAAEALFAFGDNRWTPLRQRGERASASFNCSFDAYRRARRSTGVSLLDETVRQLAGALDTNARTAAVDVGGGPSDPAADDAPPSAAASDIRSPDRGRRLFMVAGALVLLLIVVAGVVVITTREDSGNGVVAAASTIAVASTTSHVTTAGGGATGCHPVGQSTDPALAAYEVPFETQVSQLTPPGEAEPCGGSPVMRWDQLVIQPLVNGGAPDGALVAIDPDHVLLMSQAEYSSYHQVGGKDGTQAQALAGLPRRRAMSASGKVSLIITDHGAMASAGVDQPGFYLGDVVWSTWHGNGEDTGDWGTPASNPLNNAVGYYQDFSKGRLTLSYTGALAFHEVDDPAATLPAEYRGQILRHDDGTTWYVDDHDVRHWIPDGDTWFCINDRGSREIGHVPGYAISTLELGAPATCVAEK